MYVYLPSYQEGEEVVKKQNKTKLGYTFKRYPTYFKIGQEQL